MADKNAMGKYCHFNINIDRILTETCTVIMMFREDVQIKT